MDMSLKPLLLSPVDYSSSEENPVTPGPPITPIVTSLKAITTPIVNFEFRTRVIFTTTKLRLNAQWSHLI
jgi:hypothetical protein